MGLSLSIFSLRVMLQGISVGFCTAKYATPISYHIPSDAIFAHDHTIYHCYVTSTSSIIVKNYRANKEGMLSAVSPNVLFSVIEQSHTDSMDLANFLLRHWGSRYVLLSNCVYYLIPVGYSAFGFPCYSCLASYILLQ